MQAGSTKDNTAFLALLCSAGAALMMAHQVAAKAARDALFLEHFAMTALPAMMAVAAATAIVAALLFARILTRLGPIALLPSSLLLSAALHAGEYFLIHAFARPVTVFAYLHVVGFGAILLSAFWSAAGEAFTPRDAKRVFARVAAVGTVGGVVGGLIAERVASIAGGNALLILLAGLHSASALVFFILQRSPLPRSGSPVTSESFSTAAIKAIQRTPFLRQLAILVLMSTAAAALLDYLLKSGAIQAFGRGPELARFFALFYTASQVMSFAVQAGISPFLLRTLGLGRSVTLLPAAVFAGACCSLLIPVFPAIVIVRGLEAILRSSLFRSGYELFFTPILPNEKRPVKTAIDVGCDRLGDALGAGVLQIVLLFGSSNSFAPLLFIAAALALACIGIARQMDGAYLRVLENGLRNRAIQLQPSEVHDATTLLGFTRVMPAVPKGTASASLPQAQPIVQAEVPTESLTKLASNPLAVADESLLRLQDLRSRDVKRIEKALEHPAFDALLIPQAIKLLAWNEANQAARVFLEEHVEKVSGQLLDTLNDNQQDFAIRRRIPRILSRSGSQRVIDGLTEALSDPRFDVRFAVSRALESIHRHHPELRFNTDHLTAIVLRELSVSKNIWAGRRLLDEREEAAGDYRHLDEVLQNRANCSLEHVFSLLAIFVAREPLKLAFRALHGNDAVSEGLGLEYLETALKPEIFRKLSELVEPNKVVATTRNQENVLRDLMAQESIRFEVSPQLSDAPVPSEPPAQSKGE